MSPKILVVVNDDDVGLLVLVIMDVAAGVLLLLALENPGYADDDGSMESWRGAPFVLMR